MRRIRRTIPLLAAILPAIAQAAAGPVITANGIVNAAEYTNNAAPGIMIAIFGSNLAPRSTVSAGVPVPRSLEGVSVEVLEPGGSWTAAPLYFVSATQLDIQLPFVAATNVQLRVRNASGVSPAVALTLSPRAPRIFTRTMDGRGEPILYRPSGFSWVSAAAPAIPGEHLILLLTGLGAVTPAKDAGAAGGDDGANGPHNTVADPVFVSFGGVETAASFAGLMPGVAGVYQVEFQVPAAVPAGLQAVQVRVGTARSQSNVAAYASDRMQATVGPAGGEVAGPGGLRLQFPEGAVAGSVGIGLSSLGENDLSAALRAALAEMKLTFAFGFRLTAGARFGAPVTATVPNGTGFRVGTGVLVAEGRPESDGEPMLIDAVQVAGDTMTSAAQGFPGIRGAGDYVFAVPALGDGVTDMVYITGQVMLNGQPAAGMEVGALDSPFVSLTDGSGSYIVYSGVGVRQLPRNVLLIAQSVGAVNVATAGERMAVMDAFPVFSSRNLPLLPGPVPGVWERIRTDAGRMDAQRDERESRKYSVVRQTAKGLCTACQSAAGRARVSLANKINGKIGDYRDRLLADLQPELSAHFQEPLQLGIGQSRTFASYPIVWPLIAYGVPKVEAACPGTLEVSLGSLKIFPELAEIGQAGPDPLRVTALNGLPPAPAEMVAEPTLTPSASLEVGLRGTRGGLGTLNGHVPVQKVGIDQRGTFTIPLGGMAIECPQDASGAPKIEISDASKVAPVNVNALVEVSDCDSGPDALTGLWLIPAPGGSSTCVDSGYSRDCEPRVEQQQLPSGELYPVPFPMEVCQKGTLLTGHRTEPGGAEIDFRGSVAGSGAGRRVEFRMDAVMPDRYFKIAGAGAMAGSMQVQIEVFIASDTSCGQEVMRCSGGGPSTVTFLPMPVF